MLLDNQHLFSDPFSTFIRLEARAIVSSNPFGDAVLEEKFVIKDQDLGFASNEFLVVS